MSSVFAARTAAGQLALEASRDNDMDRRGNALVRAFSLVGLAPTPVVVEMLKGQKLVNGRQSEDFSSEQIRKLASAGPELAAAMRLTGLHLSAAVIAFEELSPADRVKFLRSVQHAGASAETMRRLIGVEFGGGIDGPGNVAIRKFGGPEASASLHALFMMIHEERVVQEKAAP